jgi:hypothetical protein
MNDLGKQLSMFSFGVIGVIVLIGIIQKRSWLDMFTIGGKYKNSKHELDIQSCLYSESCCCSYP